MERPKRLYVPLALVCALLGVAAATGPRLYDLTDEEADGPEQPISFSHKLHAGAVDPASPQTTSLGIDCLYCHGPAEKSQHATVPPVSTCMGCHQHVKARQAGSEADATPEAKARYEASKAEIAKIHDFYNRGESIPWVKIHNLPEHVQFQHYRHVQAGFDCQRCHGPVEEMQRVFLKPDTVLRPYSLWLPAAKLEMGWCMQCHLDNGGPDDCAACHY